MLAERQCEIAEVLVMVLDDEPASLEDRLPDDDFGVAQFVDKSRAQLLEKQVVEHDQVQHQQFCDHVHRRQAHFEVDVLDQGH